MTHKPRDDQALQSIGCASLMWIDSRASGSFRQVACWNYYCNQILSFGGRLSYLKCSNKDSDQELSVRRSVVAAKASAAARPQARPSGSWPPDPSLACCFGFLIVTSGL